MNLNYVDDGWLAEKLPAAASADDRVTTPCQLAKKHDLILNHKIKEAELVHEGIEKENLE